MGRVQVKTTHRSKFLRILISHLEHPQDRQQCCPLKVPWNLQPLQKTEPPPAIPTYHPQTTPLQGVEGQNMDVVTFFFRDAGCKVWVCLYLPKIPNKNTGFTFLEKCTTKNKKNSLNPCHQHHSSALRGMSLVKTHKQGQHPPQGQKMAEGDLQTTISVDPKSSWQRELCLRWRDLMPGCRRPMRKHSARYHRVGGSGGVEMPVSLQMVPRMRRLRSLASTSSISGSLE